MQTLVVDVKGQRKIYLCLVIQCDSTPRRVAVQFADAVWRYKPLCAEEWAGARVKENIGEELRDEGGSVTTNATTIA